MEKVNSLDAENVSIPDYAVIIDRLKEVSGIQSDAGLSKWLGKPTSFIATCRNRGGINIEVALPKLTDAQIVFVLRGRQLEQQSAQVIVPTVKHDIADVLDATRRSVESLARQAEATPEELESWMSGKTAPSYEQLAAILHLVVPVALAHCDHGAATSKRKVA